MILHKMLSIINTTREKYLAQWLPLIAREAGKMNRVTSQALLSLATWSANKDHLTCGQRIEIMGMICRLRALKDYFLRSITP
jgi:hypothetical protein